MVPIYGGILRDPFTELQRLHGEVNRLFERGPRRWTRTEYPAMNVYAGENDVLVEAELPGYEAKDIDVSVVQSTLTVRGERPDEAAEGRSYHRRERGFGKFVRSLELPFNVDGDGVEAELKDGILTIKLPRVVEERLKKIEVKAS
jgi:HSP20 family protein